MPTETLETLCRNQGIPVSYAATFAEAMVTQGWEVKTTLQNGTVVPTKVTAMNAGMILGTWYRREKSGGKADEVTLRQGRTRSRFSEGGGGEGHR